MKPVVSVLMPTFNHERYLAQALDSALQQVTDFDYEIVVGEDASTDGTRDLLLDYARRHPGRIVPVLHQRNMGWRRNFNETLAQCRGDFIALLEGDDWWISPHKLQKQVDLLRDRTDCVLCFTRTRRYVEGGEELESLPTVAVRHVTGVRDIIACQYVQTCSVMLRRSAIGTGMPAWFEGLRMGDWPLWILTAHHGKLVFLDEPLAAYRVHSGGLWSGTDPITMCREVIRMLERLEPHVSRKYRGDVRQALAKEYFELSWLLRDAGKPRAAKKAVDTSIRLSPMRKNATKPRVAAMWARYHLTPLRPLVRVLRTANPNLGR